MASKARFGRLPRSAPSLTSTIVALAQQYQQTRDRNIEDAWKNGGTFEGKKVTDKQVLDHWKERRDGVSTDDPMWDYYDNQVYQYDFTIEESKMGQKYAEKSVSDGEMASFYRKWAKKMPVDSENYRQLMTQAAKFKSAATARGYSRRSGANADAYAKAQQKTYDQHEAPYDIAIQLITRYAVGQGILDPGDLKDPATGKDRPDYGWSQLINAKGEDDPTAMADLLSDIMANPDVKAGMTAIIRQSDPTFSGQFTDESLAGLSNNARNGAQARNIRAMKAGDKTGAKGAAAAVDKYALSSMIIRASLGDNTKPHNGFVEQNEFYRGQMDAALAPNSGLSPMERAAAIQRYGTWLAGDGMNNLNRVFPAGSLDPLSPNYNVFASGLVGRVNNTLNALQGKSTGQTLKDDLFGLSRSEAGAESDAVRLGTTSSELQTALADVASGNSIIVKTDSNGKPDVKGDTWSIKARSGPDMGNVELVPIASPAFGSVNLGGVQMGGEGGEVRYLPTQDIRVTAYGAADPQTGEALSPLNPLPDRSDVVGSRVEMQGPGGTTYTLFGVYQNGQKVWTSVDPFAATDPNGGPRTEGPDSHGNYVIGYKAPGAMVPGVKAPPYDPQSFIQQSLLKQPVSDPNHPGQLLDSTDGTVWDPQQDKQTVWGSPLSALANTSSDSLKFVAAMGNTAIKNAEREWYKDPNNWTPTMKAQAAAGADPRNVVEAAANNLYQQVAQARTYGYTPEDQQANRSSAAAYAAGRGAAQFGLTPAQMTGQIAKGASDAADATRRADMVSQLTKWAQQPADLARRTQGLPTGPGNESNYAGLLKKGWTITDILNQPGMSLDQANDLAAQISGGAVGSRMPDTVTTRQLPGQGPNRKVETRTPAINPYAPGGQVPVKAPAYVAPVVKPKTVDNPHPGKAADDLIPVKVKPGPITGVSNSLRNYD